MSYIQNNLQAGEEIKYKADIHWYIFAYPVILLLLSVFFSSAQTGFFHYVSLFLLLSGLFQLIKRILLKMGTEYVVTNKKVILKSGILSRDALELVLNKCEGIRINQSLMGRMLGFGSVSYTHLRCIQCSGNIGSRRCFAKGTASTYRLYREFQQSSYRKSHCQICGRTKYIS